VYGLAFTPLARARLNHVHAVKSAIMRRAAVFEPGKRPAAGRHHYWFAWAIQFVSKNISAKSSAPALPARQHRENSNRALPDLWPIEFCIKAPTYNAPPETGVSRRGLSRSDRQLSQLRRRPSLDGRVAKTELHSRDDPMAVYRAVFFGNGSGSTQRQASVENIN